MKEILKAIKNYKSLKVVISIILGLFILGITFQLGLFVGYHKASFARDWGEHYGRNFGMERPESFGGMMGGKLPMPHGASGKVLSVSLPTFIIEDRDGTEKTILITDKTIIKKGRDNASSTIIKAEDLLMIIGDPNTQGQIEAKLIRDMGIYGSSTPMGMMGNMMFRR